MLYHVFHQILINFDIKIQNGNFVFSDQFYFHKQSYGLKHSLCGRGGVKMLPPTITPLVDLYHKMFKEAQNHAFRGNYKTNNPQPRWVIEGLFFLVFFNFEFF